MVETNNGTTSQDVYVVLSPIAFALVRGSQFFFFFFSTRTIWFSKGRRRRSGTQGKYNVDDSMAKGTNPIITHASAQGFDTSS